jgi:hypothetical protein
LYLRNGSGELLGGVREKVRGLGRVKRKRKRKKRSDEKISEERNDCHD